MIPTDTFLGWPAVRLGNGTISAVMVPDIGGRVLQFWLGEHPFLFINQSLTGRLFSAQENWGDGTMSSWKNYGGNKTWPAPQGWDGPGQWAGPPDPVLDSGRFDIVLMEQRRTVVQSPPDDRTGLQITRDFQLDPHAARATLRRGMRNISQRAVRWSLWDVTQLDCSTEAGVPRPGCRMTIPIHPHSKMPGGYTVQYGPTNNPQWRTDRSGLLDVEYTGALGKVGLDSQAGWVAFSDSTGDWVFAHRFEVIPGAQYPDNGSTVEVWTQGPGVAAGVDFGQPHLRGSFMEMEVLGPLTDLSPGTSSSVDLTWAACRCPGPVIDITPYGCCGRALELSARGGEMWHVQGAWGVFDSGSVRLLTLPTRELLFEQAASPLEPVELDHDVRVPGGTAGVDLVLLRDRGDSVRLVSASLAH